MDRDALKAFLSGIYPLTPEELEGICADWQPIECKRKTVLTAAGETERYMYFVLEGVQRAFYLGDGNLEATIVFTYPPSFSGVADSFLTQTPSRYYLETLTASRLLRISHDEIQERIRRFPVLQTLLFRATAFALKGALERHIELQTYSNEEKFRTLLRRSPHILQLVPQKYLASYLGMDPTNFSKLLATVRV
jgi:CRP-like cAMP-binding protein